MTESEATGETTGAVVVTAPMPLARFRTLIATSGAAPERWPDSERDAAHALLARSSEARAAHDAAAVLDRVLASAEPPPAPSEDLVRELHRRFAAARTPKHPFRPGWRAPLAGWVTRSGVALAGVAAVLFVVVVVRDQASPMSDRAVPLPAIVGAGPSLELAAGDLVEDTGPLDLEIALIDRSLLDAPGEGWSGEPVSVMGLTVASAPSLDDLPLD